MYHAWKYSMEVEWSFERPDMVEDIPAYCRGVGLGDF